MAFARLHPPLVFFPVFSEVLSDFIALLWAGGCYRFLGGQCPEQAAGLPPRFYRRRAENYCCTTVCTHNYGACPFCSRRPLLNCASLCGTVMPRSFAVKRRWLFPFVCSWLFLGQWGIFSCPLSSILIFQTIFLFSQGHFSILILTCEILVVLLPAGIFMCGWEWGICWPDSLTQMHEWEWVPSPLFAIRDLYV